MSKESLINIAEVCTRLGLSRKSVDGLIKTRSIPVIRVNARCLRFRWPDVEAALAKLEVREVGR